MITFILKIIIVICLIYMVHHVHSMIQYNKNAIIKTIEVPNKDKIIQELKNKQPLLIIYPENKLDMTIDSMNKRVPGYIIKDGTTLISLEKLRESETFEIEDNEMLVQDFKLNEHMDSIFNLIKEITNCDISYKLSLMRGKQQSRLYKNYRERLLLQSMNEPYTLYLFNPKHETEIKGLELNSIKKWGIKVEVAKDIVMSIPTEWSYFYECDGELVLYKIECDSIPSWLFNRIRRK